MQDLSKKNCKIGFQNYVEVNKLSVDKTIILNFDSVFFFSCWKVYYLHRVNLIDEYSVVDSKIIESD